MPNQAIAEGHGYRHASATRRAANGATYAAVPGKRTLTDAMASRPGGRADAGPGSPAGTSKSAAQAIRDVEDRLAEVSGQLKRGQGRLAMDACQQAREALDRAYRTPGIPHDQIVELDLRARQLERRATALANQPPSTGATRGVPDLADGALQATGTDLERDLPVGTQAVSAESHREGLIQEIGKIPTTLLEWIDRGVGEALKVIPTTVAPRRSSLDKLLSAGISMALGAIAGELGGWLAAPLMKPDGAKLVGKLIGAAVKSAFTIQLGPAAVDLSDLETLFATELWRQIDDAKGRLTVSWSSVHDHLATLSTPALEDVATQLRAPLAGGSDQVHGAIARQTMVAWTNLVARAVHGGMAGWDTWATNGSQGAIALQGARAPTPEDKDPTGGNVDPQAMDAALDDSPGCAGVLEIALDHEGRLIRGTDYGMHLRGAGDKVARALRAFGTVRALEVNKVVRMYEPDDYSWRMIASVLITADGYVRRTNWGELANVVMPNHATTPWGAYKEKHDCFANMMHGQETADCHMDHEKNDRDIAAFAEKAQALLLSDLEAS